MFCSKCGKELKGSDPYCPNCGTKVGSQGGNDFGSAASSFASSVSKINPIKNNSLVLLGDTKPLFFVSVLCQILCCILIGVEMFSVEVDAYFYSEITKIGLFEGNGFLKFLVHAGYIISAGMLLLPILKKTEWSKLNLLPAVIMPILGVLWFVFFLVSGDSALWEYEDLVEISVSLSTAGWLFLTLSVVAVLVSWKNLKTIPAEQEYQSQRVAEAQLCATGDSRTQNGHAKCKRCGHVQKASTLYCQNCFEPM